MASAPRLFTRIAKEQLAHATEHDLSCIVSLLDLPFPSTIDSIVHALLAGVLATNGVQSYGSRASTWYKTVQTTVLKTLEQLQTHTEQAGRGESPLMIAILNFSELFNSPRDVITLALCAISANTHTSEQTPPEKRNTAAPASATHKNTKKVGGRSTSISEYYYDFAKRRGVFPSSLSLLESLVQAPTVRYVGSLSQLDGARLREDAIFSLRSATRRPVLTDGTAVVLVTFNVTTESSELRVDTHGAEGGVKTVCHIPVDAVYAVSAAFMEDGTLLLCALSSKEGSKSTQLTVWTVVTSSGSVREQCSLEVAREGGELRPSWLGVDRAGGILFGALKRAAIVDACSTIVGSSDSGDDHRSTMTMTTAEGSAEATPLIPFKYIRILQFDAESGSVKPALPEEMERVLANFSRDGDGIGGLVRRDGSSELFTSSHRLLTVHGLRALDAAMNPLGGWTALFSAECGGAVVVQHTSAALHLHVVPAVDRRSNDDETVVPLRDIVICGAVTHK